MLGKFAATAGIAAIAILSAASIGIIVTSSVPAVGMNASTGLVTRTEALFCAPKKAPLGDHLIFCGASPAKF